MIGRPPNNAAAHHQYYMKARPPQPPPSNQQLQPISTTTRPQQQQYPPNSQPVGLAGFPHIDRMAKQGHKGIRVPLGAAAMTTTAPPPPPPQSAPMPPQQQMGMVQGRPPPPPVWSTPPSTYTPPPSAHGTTVTQNSQLAALVKNMTSSVIAPRAEEAPIDFGYTELLLQGLANLTTRPLETVLKNILPSVTGGRHQLGSWKVECWRSINDGSNAARTGNLVGGQQAVVEEIWYRKYIKPDHLKGMNLIRIYSPEHLVVTSSSPVNARRVTEAAVSPAFPKILSSLGFRKRHANDVYVAGHLFHVNPGIRGAHLQLLIATHYKDEALQEELFPGNAVVELSCRVYDDSLIEPATRKMLEFTKTIDFFSQLTRL